MLWSLNLGQENIKGLQYDFLFAAWNITVSQGCTSHQADMFRILTRGASMSGTAITSYIQALTEVRQ